MSAVPTSAGTVLEFTLAGGETVTAPVGRVVIGGWTGRDQAHVARYVDGLVRDKGFRKPSSLPCFYEVAPALLTQAAGIDVLGNNTSGEVEVILVAVGDTIHVGLGSDHTDRLMAPASIAHAKQLCPKPVARQVWRLDEVADHWDDLLLTAEIPAAEGHVVYQQGRLAELLPLPRLLEALAEKRRDGAGCIFFCGTVPAIGGIRPASAFRMRLEDPISGRRITHEYAVNPVPVVD